MLFFRRVMRKLGGKRLWFPQLITLGKPADTEELAGRLSAMSTVSKGDVFAVLSDLPDVMADILQRACRAHRRAGIVLPGLHLARQRRGDQGGSGRFANQRFESRFPARTLPGRRPEDEAAPRAAGHGVHRMGKATRRRECVKI